MDNVTIDETATMIFDEQYEFAEELPGENENDGNEAEEDLVTIDGKSTLLAILRCLGENKNFKATIEKQLPINEKNQAVMYSLHRFMSGQDNFNDSGISKLIP